MTSERSENIGFKSSVMNLQLEQNKNSLISNELNKNTGDKKTNEFKQSSHANNNKGRRKSIERNSLFDSYGEETQKKKKAKRKSLDMIKSDKIIVDNIENIYSCLGDKSSKRYTIQKLILLIIPFFTSLCHWIFLFLTQSKLENNYCFSDLNQLDNCLAQQICQNSDSKIKLIIYNDTYDVMDNSLTDSQKFLEEMRAINSYYKTFFVNYNYEIAKGKLLSSVENIKYMDDKINFAVILTKKEKWNIFLLFSNICLRDNIYIYLLVIICAGGAIGSIIFGILADIYGRKKIIIILLLLMCFAFTFLIIITFIILNNNSIYMKDFKGKFVNDIAYFQKAQFETSKNFEFFIPLYLVCLLIICIALRPLNKISLILLLENSTSDLNALENFRKYNFVTTGIPHFLSFIILVLTNNFYIFLFVFDFFFILLFITTIIFVNESMRYHYEYCEWNNLTNEVHSLFKITEELPVNYKNIMEFEAFLIEENGQIYGNYIKRINSIFEFVKQRVIYLKRDIRRNSSFIIKKEEVKFNPLIILTSLAANRVFNRLKFLLLIILFIIYLQIFFVERELVEVPFLKISDLYLDIHNNYMINSNYFILMIVSLISNFFYYMSYRISCFKLVFYPSLVFLTILLIVYHAVSQDSNEIPINLNFANFNMKEHNIKGKLSNKITTILFLIYFFLIGINFYMNLIVTKITKTLYRCSLFGINSLLEILAFAFGETLKYQINHCFLLIAGLNTIGIVSELYLGELKQIPNIINDLKQNIKTEENKNKEKSKKTIL